MEHRILILGNSGAGKSTLAHALVQRASLQHLDLDTVVWVQGAIAQARPEPEIQAELDAFVAAHPRWVIEGSYGDWIAHLSVSAELLVFLDPGVERCLVHQERRPWEPHKYDDPQAQQERRAFLAEWTRQYPDRPDRFGRGYHQRVFDAFEGRKLHAEDTQEVLEALSLGEDR